jgi:hypothetical protein
LVSDWSRQKLLCYDVRAAILTARGYLELLVQDNPGHGPAEKALQIALENARDAANKSEELFQEICQTGERGKADRNVKHLIRDQISNGLVLKSARPINGELARNASQPPMKHPKKLIEQTPSTSPHHKKGG